MDRLSDYDYDLPREAIAQEPLADRAASRLLVLHKDTGLTEDMVFREVPKLLSPGDLLVINDTRVTALRVHGTKESGGKVELLLLRELSPGRFSAMAKPGRRMRPGTKLLLADLEARVVADMSGGEKLIEFPEIGNLKTRLQSIGSIPLPPYITTSLDDAERYQTVYATRSGSAAAPTAGLHFTAELLRDLRAKGVGIATVTLDVGLDTFRPIQTEDLDSHQMHGERCTMPVETAEAIASCNGKIIAVGTTVVRTLESFSKRDGSRAVETGVKETKLFIRPGYRFKIVDGMFTNFHMPRTSMLALISAMAGRESVLRSYARALQLEYRFLSFGDAMLIY